jgi:acylphosphatase
LKCRQLHAIVSGRVQGVGFRYFVRDRAQALDLTGWVRNLTHDGSVELIAEGHDHSLKELEQLIREGPSFASVNDVHVAWSDDVEGFSSFEIRT